MMALLILTRPYCFVGTTPKWISNEMDNHGILIQAIDRGCNAAKFYSSEYEDENLKQITHLEAQRTQKLFFTESYRLSDN